MCHVNKKMELQKAIPIDRAGFQFQGVIYCLRELSFILEKYFHVIYFLITLRNPVFLIEKSVYVA